MDKMVLITDRATNFFREADFGNTQINKNIQSVINGRVVSTQLVSLLIILYVNTHFEKHKHYYKYDDLFAQYFGSGDSRLVYDDDDYTSDESPDDDLSILDRLAQDPKCGVIKYDPSIHNKEDSVWGIQQKTLVYLVKYLTLSDLTSPIIERLLYIGTNGNEEALVVKTVSYVQALILISKATRSFPDNISLDDINDALEKEKKRELKKLDNMMANFYEEYNVEWAEMRQDIVLRYESKKLDNLNVFNTRKLTPGDLGQHCLNMHAENAYKKNASRFQDIKDKILGDSKYEL